MAVTQRDAHLKRTGLWRVKQRVTKRSSIDVTPRMLVRFQSRTRNGNTNEDKARTGARDQKMNLTPAKQCLSESAHKAQLTSNVDALKLRAHSRCMRDIVTSASARSACYGA